MKTRQTGYCLICKRSVKLTNGKLSIHFRMTHPCSQKGR